MRTRLAAIVFLVLALCTLPFAAASNVEPAQAAPVEVINCTSFKISSDQVRIQCTAAGIIVLNTVVDLPDGPTVEVTLPPVTETVRVPGPTETKTIEVEVPGPTQTVTLSGPTSTVTQSVETTETATTSVTQTVTSSPSSTGQVDNEDGTVDPSPSEDSDEDVIVLPGPTTVEGAALGTLAFFIILALILAALYGGYYLGYKDADKHSARWMKRLLNKE